MTEAVAATCPCGSGDRYDACCGRLHRGSAQAATPEELMRSRYSAYVVGDLDHVWRTWHPRTRPDRDALGTAGDADALTWTGLVIHEAPEPVPGGSGAADRGEVEFTASFDGGSLHERSRFERRAGRWLYVDGDVS